ncbi:dTMP kinase [Helicobacter sp. MIT 05-5293]|uniref:dTMP kinase n=1 Tax=Helicobacter sp. MIT 05-5293 TaxID=1548149 RepID=UPI00051D302C|nr:dTMP kinase [Helicobacter sp. MIT 05-5293]TLD82073.1 dTMP kinase [Helicobacter sp. MIT 05-5293]
MYVAIEGIDTCGKSTQIELLKACYPDATFTKEPGGSALGEQIRNLILYPSHNAPLDSRAELFLFLADRAQHYHEVLSHHRHTQTLVISDRSLVSGIAYAKDVDKEWNLALNIFALREMLPDLVVILKLDRDTLCDRMRQKSHDHIESRGIDYMLTIQDQFISIVQMMKVKFVVLDAKQSQEVILERICAEIGNLM